MFLQGQTITVKGFVFSEEERAGLIGVNILDKATLKGAATDFDGTFELQIDQANIPATLVFGYPSNIVQFRQQRIYIR